MTATIVNTSKRTNTMNDKRLLLEYRPLSYDRSPILESIRSGGPLTLRGVFQEANALNQNGRIYPMETLQREVQRFLEKINENRAYGSLDHPDSSVMELGSAAVMIKELAWDGNKLMGALEVLNTQKGKDLRAILEAGGQVGMSSRAFGSTSKNSQGHDIVNEDLELITFDCVGDPSVKKAILTESYNSSVAAKIDRRHIINHLLDTIIDWK